MDTTETPQEALSWDDEPCYAVSFGVHKSRRYHGMMREFYRRWHDGGLALTAIFGSAAFVAMLPEHTNQALVRALTLVVAVATTLDLVFDPSKKADRHDQLCRRFGELAAKMHEWPATPENRERACAERLRIEEDEPTERRLVELWAYNDESRARGHRIDDLVPLTWLQRSPAGYLFRTFGERGIERRLMKRQAKTGR